MRVKAVCVHCGRKQTAVEKDMSLEYVSCRYCGKTGVLQDQGFVGMPGNEDREAIIPEAMKNIPHFRLCTVTSKIFTVRNLVKYLRYKSKSANKQKALDMFGVIVHHHRELIFTEEELEEATGSIIFVNGYRQLESVKLKPTGVVVQADTIYKRLMDLSGPEIAVINMGG
ncbi:MAG: hypothetical protein WC279_12605 [Sulfurimonas sp.]|uniref:hypothetical protein n=1 Tax=Sulfurimonas sp. TaxID=2022749 RepID=UPI003564BE28